MSATNATEEQNLVLASEDEVVEALPDDEAAIESGEAVLEFTGQAWIDERARDVDGKEETFAVPLTDLRAGDSWALDETPSRHFVSDQLHRHENAPGWIQEWDGPFELQVKSVEA
jgi:hypothetical protein